MRKVICVMVVIMMVLCGCSHNVVQPAEPIPVAPRVEYIYANSSDVVRVTDTVRIVERPDTFLMTEIKTRYICHTDTLVVHDSVTVIQPFPVEKIVYQKNPVNKFFLWWSILSVVLFFIVLKIYKLKRII